MPADTRSGLELLADRILDQNPTSVLDVRAGSGILGSRLRSLQPTLSLTAINPEGNRSHEVYNHVMYGQPLLISSWPIADVVVFQDPLSELGIDDARQLWGRSRDSASTAAYLTLSLAHWDPRWVQRWFFGISECWQDETTGYYGWYRS